METIKMKCRNCGANLETDSDRKVLFCNFCGEKHLLDDGTIRVDINQKSDETITHRIEIDRKNEETITNVNVVRDEAKVKHEEINELKLKANAEGKTRMALLIALCIIWSLIIILGIITVVLLVKSR